MAFEYRLSSLGIEVLRAGAIIVPARVNASQLEVLRSGVDPVPVQVNSASIEVLRRGFEPVTTRVGGVQVEVLRSIAVGIHPLFFDGTDVAAFPIIISPQILPAFVNGEQSMTFPVEARNAPYVIKDVERNPYAPRLPVEQVEQQEVLSEQQRIIREQHNKTQAGDTTFDYGLLLKNYPNREFTLGSLGRFYHEDHGLILARYCKFKSMLATNAQGVPVGRLLTSVGVDWVVTNDYSKSGRDLVLGLCCVAEVPADETYGWIVTHGCNPVSMGNASAVLAAQNAPYSWSATGKVSLGIRGRVLARRWGQAYLPTIPPGGAFVALEGLSPADLVFEIREAMAAEIALIATLQGRVVAVEGRMTSAEGNITSLTAGQAALTARIAAEEVTRARDVTSIRLLASGTDWTPAIRAEANLVRTEFAAADDVIRTLATSADYKASLALARTDGIDYAGLLSRVRGLEISVAAGIAGIPRFNVDSNLLTGGEMLLATSAIDSEGNTYYEFTTTNALEYIQDVVGAQITGGVGIDAIYNDSTGFVDIAIDVSVITAVVPVTTSANTYTLVIGDAQAYRRFTHATGCAITIPPNSAVAFPIGTTFTGRTVVSAATSFNPGVGVTLNKVAGGTGAQTFAEIGATAQVKKVGTDEWDIIGAVA